MAKTPNRKLSEQRVNDVKNDSENSVPNLQIINCIIYYILFPITMRDQNKERMLNENKIY